MPQTPLQNIRDNRKRLRVVAAMLLLVWVGLGQAIAWHDATHILESDNHCAICASPLKFNHSLASKAPAIAVTKVKPVLVFTKLPVFCSVACVIPGNRDPPVTV